MNIDKHTVTHTYVHENIHALTNTLSLSLFFSLFHSLSLSLSLTHTHTHTRYSDIAGATAAAKRNVRDFVQRRITTPTVSIMNDVVLNR